MASEQRAMHLKLETTLLEGKRASTINLEYAYILYSAIPIELQR